MLLAGTFGLLARHGTPGLRPAPAQAAGPTAQAGGPGTPATGKQPAQTAGAPAAQPVAFPVPTAPIVAAPQSAPPHPVAAPVALLIPQIGVSTRLVTLGLTAQGAVQVPSSTTVGGWYTRSPRPGAVGPAIILGHIDSYRGPGVFFRLPALRPGDLVYVRRSDGSQVTFRVTGVQSYLKNEFPTQAVYGPTPDAELRLITCGGAFDAASGHYLSNIVVYATATGAKA